MPTAVDTGRLGSEAIALRDTCLAALAVIGVTPDAYLYPGLPPVEVGEPPCDGMLAIYVPNISRLPVNLGRGPLAAGGNQTTARVPTARFTVVFAMCVDVWGDEQGNAPEPDDLTAQALNHMTAGWVLMCGVQHAVARDELFAQCRYYALGDLTPLSVQGNSAGWAFDVTIQVDGFDPFA